MCAIFSTGALKKKARTNVKNPVVQRAQTPIIDNTLVSIMCAIIQVKTRGVLLESIRVDLCELGFRIFILFLLVEYLVPVPWRF